MPSSRGFVNGCGKAGQNTCLALGIEDTDCFVGCLANYGLNSRSVKRPESGHVLAPWVIVEFKGSGSVITVGNESAPDVKPKHTAVIQSFEFGYHDGMKVNLTIQDQQGGSFVTFCEHLFKDWICSERGVPPAAEMQFQFGWCKAGCNGILPEASSPCYCALVDSVETNFREGKFVAQLTGVDLGTTMFEGISDKIRGGLGQEGECLTQAIRKLLIESEPPNVKKVDFLRMENGVITPAGFEIEHCGFSSGPKGKWIANGRDKLTIAKNWIDGWRSDKKHGWMMQYDSTYPGGRIIFWEDRRPKCKAESDEYWEKNSIGTYVVNGGKSSPVIEFNPKIKWNFSTLISGGGAISNETTAPLADTGGAGDNAGGRTSKTPGRRECFTLTRAAMPGAGKTMQATNTENHKNIEGKNAVDRQHKGYDAALKALKVLHDNITADLVIVGDPTLLPPNEAIARNCTIIFINPFYLQEGTGCQDWTVSEPPCNEVLTNKAWQIKQVTHRIEAGRFTTTLEVYLAAPGIDGDRLEPLGLWVNGWRPPSQC